MPEWTARPRPGRVTLEGRYCRLEPVQVDRHAAQLYAAYCLAPDARDWTYLNVGPFADENDYRRYAGQMEQSNDPLHFAIVDRASEQAVGTFSLMRIDTANGVMEVGYVAFSRRLQKTRMATEAHYLLMCLAFDQLGYRRYEWKCDSLNAPSRAAALRLGFTFEGIFRQAVVYRGRTRDTAWFSLLDSEWPLIKGALARWLAEDNFDPQGKQKKALSEV
nr:GNAT family protein [Affinibrenneria salicis]